jgi:hypothetical protein
MYQVDIIMPTWRSAAAAPLAADGIRVQRLGFFGTWAWGNNLPWGYVLHDTASA